MPKLTPALSTNPDKKETKEKAKLKEKTFEIPTAKPSAFTSSQTTLCATWRPLLASFFFSFYRTTRLFKAKAKLTTVYSLFRQEVSESRVCILIAGFVCF